MTETKANRTYKDRLFRMLFSERQELLSLYNAVNNSSYTNAEELEITTLEDVLYLGMKNDVSFLIDECMNLYEEQSTWNPNMPLRGLFYFSRLYSGYIKKHRLDIYSRTLLALPTPQYIVFYNGGLREPEIQRLRLSSAYKKNSDEQDLISLECIATVLNIRHGQNSQLMKNCRRLYEYSYLISRIQAFLATGITLEAAIDQAIGDCLRHDILTDFLQKHRGEAKLLILTEYDEELHRKTLYNEGYEDGVQYGQKVGEEQGWRLGEEAARNRINTLIQRLLQLNRLEDLKRASEDIKFQQKLLDEFGL